LHYYAARGWTAIPIISRGKKAAVVGWQRRVVADARPEEFTGRNIGLALGAPSGNLVDVDLDCAEAVVVARYLLPPTGMIHGRAGRRGSHRWYVVADAPHTTRYRSPLPDGGTLVELRGTGGQTVVPPSIHPSGEILEWADWPLEPSQPALAELRLAVADVAVAALLARQHPGDGSRHDFALALAGTLAHLRYPFEHAEILVEAVSEAAGDANARDRRQCVVDTYRKFENGEEVVGAPTLAALVGGNAVVDKVRAWLAGRVTVAANAGFQGQLTDRLGDYARFLQYTPRGQLSLTAANATLILVHDHEFGGPPRDDFGAQAGVSASLGFDELEQQEVWLRQPPDGVGLVVPAGAFADHHEVYVQAWLQRATGLDFSKVIGAAVRAAARERNFNPVVDYLESLGWDGVERLSGWLTTYLGAPASAINKAIGRWWLISAVARAYRPGCRVDHMIVLEGPQGKKKSTALQILAGRWYSAGPEKIGDKDGMQSLRGKWIVEMAELDAIRGRELSTIKKFITDPSDMYRPSYGRRNITAARRCVFAGTTNEETYLHDVTGGRRFWPVRTGVIDDKALARDRDQLLAEAVVAFEAGESWWPLETDQISQLNEIQDERYELDAWADAISNFLDGNIGSALDKRMGPSVARREQVTVDDLLTMALSIERGRYSRADQMRVVSVLRKLRWKRVRIVVNGQRVWIYQRPAEA
jgi:predicted P-loop ATPase